MIAHCVALVRPLPNWARLLEQSQQRPSAQPRGAASALVMVVVAAATADRSWRWRRELITCIEAPVSLLRSSSSSSSSWPTRPGQRSAWSRLDSLLGSQIFASSKFERTLGSLTLTKQAAVWAARSAQRRASPSTSGPRFHFGRIASARPEELQHFGAT